MPDAAHAAGAEHRPKPKHLRSPRLGQEPWIYVVLFPENDELVTLDNWKPTTREVLFSEGYRDGQP